MRRLTFATALIACCVVTLALPEAAQTPAPAQAPSSLAPYVPTPQDVVDRMLALAGVTADDVVYDLGCGDGRIVITAARKFGARGVGVDIDPERIKESEANAKAAGVESRVSFRMQDAMTVDVSPATVVTLYLLSSSNAKLRPILTKQLRPGARIVSHAFSMGDW
jgi:precorrin-6B methylase 2